MPTPTLDATAGGSASNSYCTVAEADAYFDSRLYTTVWAALTTPQKTVALIMATRVLDAQIEWSGDTRTFTQRLMWPRYGMLKRNKLEYVPDTEIPEELKFMTAELALQLSIADRTADSDIETQGITSLTAGPVSLTFSDDVEAKVIPDSVYFLMPEGWGVIRGNTVSFGRVRRA